MTTATPPPDQDKIPLPGAAKIISDHRLAPYAAIDCETTGTDREKHEAISLAVVLADGMLNEVDNFHIHIRPTRIENASLESLVIAGYDPAALRSSGLSKLDAATALMPWLTGRRLIAHYLDFDRTFFAQLLREAHKNPPWGGRGYCTLEAARAAVKAAKLPSKGASLVAVCDALLIPLRRVEGEPHSALDDARAVLAVARAFRQRGWLKL